MKNKSKKLARNAIRARKAKNKRANEQDKPKKGKRWLIRLGALMGCLLLVSALVVPCFADDYFDGIITDDYYTAFVNTDIPEIYHDRDCLMHVINTYRDGLVRNAEPDGLFGCELLCYGLMNYNSETTRPFTYPAPEYKLGEDTVINYQVYLEFIDIEVSLDSTSNPLILVLDEPTFDFSLQCSGDDVAIEITLTGIWYDEDDTPFENVLVFRNTQGTYNSNMLVEFLGPYTCSYYENDQFIGTGDALSIETAYTVKNTFLFGTSITGAGLIQTFLLSENSASYYNPLAFANGYYAGKNTAPTYEQGYDDGYTLGYNNGRNEGYIIGHNEGYDLGYIQGEQVGYDEGYTDGYGVGINATDSVNLGKNLLGDTLTAPLEALNNFNLVSWQTANGNIIEISIMTIVSAIVAVGLFFLFIKMFAGG